MNRRRNHSWLIIAVLLFAGIGVSDTALAQTTSEASAPEGIGTLTTSRVNASMTVDGHLDEAAWQQVEAATNFRQFKPNEGAPATQRTEVRVLYGDDNLYVGAMLYDETPSRIAQTLGRRDNYNRADWFVVSLDSYFDRQTARVFGVNAAGIQYDAILSEGGPGGPGDNSWDAIWYSAARVTAEGWVVEMRIPYSMLRFADEDQQVWGIHFQRHMPRRGEEVEWPLVPLTQRSNLVAHFAQMTGISGIDPKRNLQVRPYTVSRLETQESTDEAGTLATNRSMDVGGDLRIGLGPNITLDATVNPDFGQVEADPAVLNLTAFETFFEERRPFFVEGIGTYEFSVGPGELLYTRRIGAHAPIVGAAKLTGRTANDLSFGVLGATTGETFSPNRLYGVARLRQQIGDYSSAGGILTGFDGPGAGSGRLQSLSGGADWNLRFLDNRYDVEGFAAFTHRRGPAIRQEAKTGVAGKVWLRKRQGTVSGFVGLDAFGNDFNPNELGQLRMNNFIATPVSVNYEINAGQPFGPFQRASVGSFSIQQFAYDSGLNLGQDIDVNSRWTLRSFQEIGLSMSMRNVFGGYDLFETRGLWPWNEPSQIGIRGEFETDSRRDWQIEPEGRFSVSEEGGRSYSAGLRSEVDLGTRLSLSATLEGEWERDVLAWSSNESFWRTGPGEWTIGAASAPPSRLDPDDYVALSDPGRLDDILAPVEPRSPDHYYVPVFGERDTRSLDLTLRGTVTFVRNLSLDLYGQLFLARGQYDRFQVLQDRDTLVPFDAFPKRDEFALNSLQSNVVLRWQYRPGSTLFVVWSHGRRANEHMNPLAPRDSSPFERPFGDQIARTFDIFPQNAFLIKLNYTFLN